jgi:hypothetical protein
MLKKVFFFSLVWGARWSSGQCARRAIAEAKHRSQWPVFGWVTKIYYHELLRASEGTLSSWSRLHLQSLASTPVSWRVDVRQAAGPKNKCRIFITTWCKHVVPTPLSGIRVGIRMLSLKTLVWRLKIVFFLYIFNQLFNVVGCCSYVKRREFDSRTVQT